MTSQRARSVTLLLVVLAGYVVGIVAHDLLPIRQCTKIDACSCVFDDGTIVNLQALERKDGKPNFSNASNANNTEYYSWNPCTPFSYSSNNSACENVSVCMIRKGIPNDLLYDLGNQDTAQFLVDNNGTLKLTYTADQGDLKRVTEITLQCMKNSKFDFFLAEGEQDVTNDTAIYKLLLASKYACAYAPAVETTSISETSTAVYNETSEPTFSTTLKPTPSFTSIFPDHSDISTHTSDGSTAVTTSPPDNNSPSMIGSWTIM
ncbi:uncharacterized protein LOC128546902 isoform X2 [Mercenaria mercenaria]|uniref:uncharacterized protein LOC128546902 isoform X2 n=1 Tax=Mercenaria mercenaria TaxID=6596 RepID=UPI00234F4D8A|nr:uncharacterized protein LOC128546902 isoform X2 [Mercenaria mercenaria]